MGRLRSLLAVALMATGISVVSAAPASAATSTVTSFTECANGTLMARTCTGWLTGTLQQNNSRYAEDQVIPQRVVVRIPAGDALHTLKFQYQDRKGGVHAFDSLARWNVSVPDANPCQGLAADVAPVCASTPSTLTMKTDPASVTPVAGSISKLVKDHQLPDADRTWTMYGATLVSDTVGPHSNTAATGDDLVSASISFRNPTPAKEVTAVLLFGGHLAVGGPNTLPRAWGKDLGASSISGGSYAFELDELTATNAAGAVETSSVGAMTNNVQPGVAVPVQPPSFSITKTATPTTAAAGSKVTYVVTVTNNGGQAGSTKFVDDFDDRLTPSAVTLGGTTGGSCSATTSGNKVLNCTTGTIAAGGKQTFTYTATLPTSFTTGAGTDGCGTGTYPVRNTATLATTNAGTPASASALVCVQAAATFTVKKTAKVATAAAGAGVGYTITVTNTGKAAGSTRFVDDYDDRVSAVGNIVFSPTGGSCQQVGTTLDCATGTIAAGGTQTITYTATMPSSFDGGDGTGGCATGRYPVVNTVTIVGAPTSSATVCVDAAPKFAVKKTADTAIAAPGQVVRYTIAVSNNGSASGPATVTDDFEDAVTPTAIRSLPTGVTCTEVDLDVSTAVNRGLRCTTPSIAVGGTLSIYYDVTMPRTFGGPAKTGCSNGGYPILNTVTVGTATDKVLVCVDAMAAFKVRKSAAPTAVKAGGSVTYTVVVTNEGSAPGSTTATDDYPDGVKLTKFPAECTDTAGVLTCPSGTLAPGASKTFTYDATMPALFTGTPGSPDCKGADEYAVVNTVKVTGSSASATVCVTATPTFTVDKTATPEKTPLMAGGLVTYRVTVTNTGTAPGATSFTDVYDQRLTPSVAVSSPTGNDCAPRLGDTPKRFLCATARLAPGEKQTFTYTATMPATFGNADRDASACPDGGYPVRNTATVPGDIKVVTLCVTATPKFAIAKQAGAATAVAPGTVVPYTVTVSNLGSAQGSTSFTDVSDAFITGTLPSGCTVTARIGSGGKQIGSTLVCTITDLAAGASLPLTYDAAMPATFTGDPSTTACSPVGYPVRNVATLTGGPSADAKVCVAAAPDFTITKEVLLAKDYVLKPGDSLTYKITVTNNGTAPGSTSFVDDYDTGVTVPSTTPGCTNVSGRLECTTGRLEAGETQVFSYTATVPSTYTGDGGSVDCDGGRYPVTNKVYRGDVVVAQQTVCVTATPKLAVKKTVSDGPYSPSGTVTYTLTVTNSGSAPGSTEAVDHLDPRISVGTVPGCTRSGDDLTCPTGSIPAGGSKTFTYTATLPTLFLGDPGQTSCGRDAFAIVNGVSLTSGGTDSVTVCVPAKPELDLKKSSTIDNRSDGSQRITYTIAYRNLGRAEALDVVLRDAVPAGTKFVACSDACTVSGPTGVATWAIAPLAPLTGAGAVTLTVEVTATQACTVTNTATITTGTRPAVSSNTTSDNISPLPDPSTARANGNASGIRVTANGLLNIVTGLVDAVLGTNQTTFGSTSTSQTGVGGPVTGAKTVLSAKVTGLVDADVIRTTSASSVTPAPSEARQTTTSEIARVCLVPVGGVCTVETGTVRSVASTTASGERAAVSSAGSTIEKLKILGLDTPVDLNQTTTIALPALVFGPGSYVAINERRSSTGLVDGRWNADLTVAMIHVKITGILLGVQAVDIVVGEAVAHSEFAQTFLCGPGVDRTVSAQAYAARLAVKPIVELTQGYAQIAPAGGDESEQIAALALPADGSVLGATVADTRTTGAITDTGSTARAWAQVGGNGAARVCVLRAVSGCLISAVAVRSESRTAATTGGSTSSSAGTEFVDLKVLGASVGVTVAPNTTIALPGVGFVVLNEQVCDNGATPVAGVCTGAVRSGLTVRALHVVVTVADALLGSPGVELVVGEARTAAAFR